MEHSKQQHIYLEYNSYWAGKSVSGLNIFWLLVGDLIEYSFVYK